MPPAMVGRNVPISDNRASKLCQLILHSMQGSQGVTVLGRLEEQVPLLCGEWREFRFLDKLREALCHQVRVAHHLPGHIVLQHASFKDHPQYPQLTNLPDDLPPAFY